MSTPFKMKPGRGNMPKTGRGIPPTLMSCSPMKQEGEIELTRKYDEGKKKMTETRSNAGAKSAIEKTEGINIQTKTGEATPKGYEKKIIKSGTEIKVVDGGGNVIDRADWSSLSPTGGKAAEALTKKYNTAKLNTETSRANNASLYNATSGGTKPENLSDKQKESLVKLGKAVKK